MSLVINTNIASITAQRALQGTGDELATAMERLATGSKINSSADDAAGLAIGQRMTAQVKGLNMAVKNAGDGMAMTQTVESALNTISDMLQRMRELAVQSVNATNSSRDRSFLQEEVNQLTQEINRVSATSQFNGEKILDGTF
ncbi:MAG: flagellin, partial [Pseudomonadota bacterium]|nr:flagellin [Pseudomonadota bacterium]